MNQSQLHRLPVAVLCLALAVAAAGSALADQSPQNTGPPAAGSPADGPRGVSRQQWQACHKQADDQKLARGEARREFMRDCMKRSQPGAAQTNS
jgi:hypothetical protein